MTNDQLSSGKVRTSRRAAWTLVGVILINMLGFGIIVPLLPFYAKSLQAPPWAVALIFSAYSVGAVFGEPFWGRMSDRYGRKPLLISTVCGNCLCYLALAFAPNMYAAFLIRLCGGLASGNGAVVQGYLTDVAPPGKATGRLSLLGAAWNIGLIIGPSLGGLLAQPDQGPAGFRLPLFAAAGLAACSAASIALFVPESRKRGQVVLAKSRWAALHEAVADPVVGRLMLLTFLVGFAFTGIESIFGLWTQARDGWGPRQIGACFACVGVAAAITQLGFTGRLAERFGEGRMLSAGMVLTVACLALQPFSPSGWATVALLSLTAIGQSVAFPNVAAMIAHAAAPARRAQILGLNNACGAAARITGPFCAGITFAGPSHNTPFFLAAGVVAPAILLARSASRRAVSAQATLRAVALTALLLCLLLNERTASAAPPGEPDFTTAQAASGAQVYAQHCASCHGASLKGAAAPALMGAPFQAQWAWPRRSVLDLLTYLRANMPLGAAGSLPQADYLAVLAFMLEGNGLPATGNPLNDDRAALSKMAFARNQIVKTTPAPMPPAMFTVGDHGLDPRATGPSQTELRDAAQGRDWLMSNKDFSGDRSSPLQIINRSNVAQIQKLCSVPLKASVRSQTSPLVRDGVLYVSSGYWTAAINAATCKLIWQYEWPSKMQSAVSAANRGVAIKDGRVIRGTADGHLIALDAADGTLLWARQVSNPMVGEIITMAPLIYDDLVFIGPAVSEFGIHGWIGAFRLNDGAPVWRFNIVPKPGTPGSETWAAHPTVPIGGGSVWNAVSIDADREILFVPTSNPAPDFAASLRGGDNLYTNSVLALHLRDGTLAWYKQIRPHDDHDWDVTQTSPLYRATIDGKPRDLLTQTGKDGILRVFDRDSHQQMFATPLTTIKNPDVPVSETGVDVCPGVLGGVQWNGAAYLSSENLLVAPAVDWCSRYTLDHDVTFIPFQTYLGGESTMISPASGWLTALDASTGRVKWRYHAPRPMIAGVTTTAGGLVLTGELTGDLLAFDAADGRVLARVPVGGQLGAGIVTYQVNASQYIAAVSGTPSAYWANPPAGDPAITIFGLANKP